MHRKLIAALLASTLMSWAGVAMATTEPGAQSSGLFLASRLAAREMDLDAAAEFTGKALVQDPKNQGLLERQFEAELARGNIKAAEDLAERLVGINSQERGARIVLGMKEFEAKNYEKARKHFDEAAFTPFGTLTSALLSAWAYAGEGELQAALRELDKLKGQDVFANYRSFHTGLIADHLSSAIRAEGGYRKAYEQAPNALRIVLGYGNFLERQGRAKEAEKIYRKFLEISDGNVLVGEALRKLTAGEKPESFVATPVAGAGEVLFSIASALNNEQGGAAALTFAQLALQSSSDKPFVLTTLAGVQTGLQMSQAAIESYKQIPVNSILRNYADVQIALNLNGMGKAQEAIGSLKAVVARDPQDIDAVLSLAGILRNQDKFEEAAAEYSKAIALLPSQHPGLARVYYDRAVAFERLKQFDKAEPDFRKSLSINKDDATTLNYLGYSMIDRGVNLEEALDMVKQAVALRPNDGYITDSLGWAYFVLGDYEKAVIELERAVDLMPSDPTLADHLGDAYWQVGRKHEAKFQWQHAIDNGSEEKDVPRIKLKLKEGLLESALPRPVKKG